MGVAAKTTSGDSDQGPEGGDRAGPPQGGRGLHAGDPEPTLGLSRSPPYIQRHARARAHTQGRVCARMDTRTLMWPAPALHAAPPAASGVPPQRPGSPQNPLPGPAPGVPESEGLPWAGHRQGGWIAGALLLVHQGKRGWREGPEGLGRGWGGRPTSGSAASCQITPCVPRVRHRTGVWPTCLHVRGLSVSLGLCSGQCGLGAVPPRPPGALGVMGCEGGHMRECLGDFLEEVLFCLGGGPEGALGTWGQRTGCSPLEAAAPRPGAAVLVAWSLSG